MISLVAMVIKVIFSPFVFVANHIDLNDLGHFKGLQFNKDLINKIVSNFVDTARKI